MFVIIRFDLFFAIIKTFELLLSVERANLSEGKGRILDTHVNTFYITIPVYWHTPRVSRTKKSLEKHHPKFLAYEISLDLPSDCNVIFT